MFIPLTTDAELKYWPFATGSLIVVHFIVLLIQNSVPPTQIESDTRFVDKNGQQVVTFDDAPGWYDFTLSHGDGLHPVQWLSSMMMHDGWGHLIGNMIFLWIFGHVIEGIVGPASFVGLYIGMGVLQNFLGQLFFLASPDMPSLGASGAIYSIMMLASIWAPQDNVQSLLLITFRPFIVNIPILIMGLFYFLWDFGFTMFQGFQMSTELLHATGAVVGFVAGFSLLAWGKIDCDDRDILSMVADARGKPKKERPSTPETPRVLTADELVLRKSKLAFAWKSFDACLDAGRPDTAIAQLNNIRKLDQGSLWDEDRLLRLIQVLQSQKRYDDVLRYSESYLELFSSRADIVRLNIARIFGLERALPGKAIKLLATINLSKLDTKNRQVAENIRAYCNKQIAEGSIEIRED